MKISQLHPEKLSDEQKTDLLFHNLQDDKKRGDCIFVPGSSKAVEYRLPKAVQLYREGRAKKILFSGGVIWEESRKTEAELLREKAMELGVPDQAILIENQSNHTKENVLASMLILDRAFQLHHLRRLLVVTTSYHMRRVMLNLKTYMPDWIDYSMCPVHDKTTREDNWFQNPYGRKRVEVETAKLIRYVKEGALIDVDVKLSGVT